MADRARGARGRAISPPVVTVRRPVPAPARCPLLDSVPSPGRSGKADVVIATVLAALTITVLLATDGSIGLTWDEPIYMEASESYIGWLGDLIQHPTYALTSEDIAQRWELNHEHPPVDKVWSGAVWSLAHLVLDDLTAHRLGNMLIASGLVGLVYLAVARGWGRPAGVVAAATLLTMPRLFFHAHLASLDFATGAAMFAFCVLFWYAQQRPLMPWTLWLGLAFGIAIGTKINALLELPVTLGLWILLFRPDQRVRLFARMTLVGLLGLAFVFVLWPWLYIDTWTRAGDYLGFMTVDHYHIGQWYLHRIYTPPPWHYPFVLTIAVVPPLTLMLSGIGAAAVMWRDSAHGLGWLLVLGGLVPMVLLVLGKAQIYDGERLWMSAFPCIAALAGVGFGSLIRLLRTGQHPVQPRWSNPLLAAIAAAVVILPVASVRDLYPNLLSYYSEAVGGLRGATWLGLETTYWADTYAEAVPVLNARAPYGAMVWAEAHDVLLYYQAHGMLRSDLRIASNHGAEGIVPNAEGYTAPVSSADLVVVAYRQSGFSDGVTRWVQDGRRIYELDRQGTPLMAIFTR
jgi:4-amino-4-deoxy-L-arabinose transferase-like glycosyltransferase